MSDNKVAVVIPVYKVHLASEEIISLKRCSEVLHKYHFIIVCSKALKTKAYVDILNRNQIAYSYAYFDEDCFETIASYNRLLLSVEFYETFKQYEYILIYQLDAYVFRDELEFWCNKGYDYIGAPLIGKHTDTVFSNEMRVGNGGFSLRRIHTFLEFFNSGKRVNSLNQIIKKIAFLKKPHTRIFLLALMLFGWRNKPKSVTMQWQYNEDDFWSGYLDDTKFKLKKPTPYEALEFAFERFPKECFELTEKLPFGCHAWEKYQYDSFWKTIIEENGA